MRRKFTFSVLVAAAGAVAAAGGLGVTAAHADLAGVENLVNVDFGNGYNLNGQGNSPTTGTLGSAVWETQTPYSLSSSTDIWNLFPEASQSTASALVNTSGSSSGLSLTFTTPGGVTEVGFNDNPDPGLFNNYLYENTLGSTTFSSTAQAQVSGLNTGTKYNLVLYPSGSTLTQFQVIGSGTYGPENISTEVGGSDVTQTDFVEPTDTAPSAVDTSAGAGNYLQFNNISPNSNGDITIQFLVSPNTVGRVEGDFSGFQIVAVPEPATLGLMALGGLGILLVGKRRRTV